jgi:hypothetical protein
MSKSKNNFVGAVFAKPEPAATVIEKMIEEDFPMDEMSMLHRAGGQGDDVLGISYSNEKERFKVWGAEGAALGSLGGLVAGAAGLFLLPGIGPVFIAGPLIDAIAGAAVGAGLMSAGAAVTHLSIAFNRLGLPEDKLQLLHQAIMDGKTVLLIHCGKDDPESWRQRASLWTEAETVFSMP